MIVPPALRYLSANLWALEPGVFEQLASLIERHANGERATVEDLARVTAVAKAGDSDQSNREPGMQMVGNVAVIPVRGVLARYSDQVNGMCQPQGRSFESLQADLDTAAADPNVRAIILRMASPGGTVAGTAETADLIRTISASGKKVIASVELAASACYWLAAHCDEVVATSTAAMAGSIGVITATIERAETAGWKTTVHRSKPLKAPGAQGQALTSDQKASVDRMIADLHGAFEDAVSAGRGLTGAQLSTAATGEMFTAARAMAVGLVDRIASFADLMREAGASLTTSTPGNTMKISTALILAVVAACPEQATLATAYADKEVGSEADFFKAMLTAERERLGKASTEAVAALAAEKTAHTATRADLEAKLAAATKTVTDLKALGGAGPDAGGAHADDQFKGLAGDERWRAEFKASKALQEAFYADALGMATAEANYLIQRADEERAKAKA